MGIVQRQGIQTTLISYTGLVLAYFNRFILFIPFLGWEKTGLADMLLSSAVIFSELARMGGYIILHRFFPYYQQHTKHKKSFTFVVTILLPLVGCILFTILFLLLKSFILARFSAKCAIFPSYYYFFLPIGYGLTFLSTFANYANANLKSVLPSFLLELGNRGFQTLAFFAFWFEYVSFSGFLWIFTSGYLLNLVVLIVYLIWLKRLHISIDFEIFRTRLMKIALIYGAYTYLARAAVIIMEQMGVLQVGELKGEQSAGIYQTAFFLSQMIYIPSRAMSAIVIPLISRNIHQKNYVELASLYKKTSLSGLLLGLFIFCLILLNISDVFLILKKDALNIAWIFFFTGLARLIDVSNGVNYAIVVFSKYYKKNLISSLVLMLLTVVLNYLLIPIWGAVGAGIASGLALLFFNGMNTYIVWQKFGVLPFQIQHVYLLFIASLSFVASFYFPSTSYPLFNVGLKTCIFSGIYITAALSLHILPDANTLAVKIKNSLLAPFHRK